jgi:hypothetical protein
MTRAVGVLLAAFFVAQAPARDGPLRPSSGTGTVRGRVVAAANGDPVRNARVTLSSERDLPPVLTDREGRFAFVNIAADKYTVTASKAGFAKMIIGDGAAGASTPISLGNGDVVDDVVLALARGAAISGTVLDDAGEPVPQASVTIERVPGRSGATPAPIIGLTDEMGRYRIGSLAAGQVLVSVFAAAQSIIATPSGGYLIGSGASLGDRIYYPGGLKAEHGEPMSLQPGNEKLGIDFIVPATVPAGARVAPPSRGSTVASGRIVAVDGRPLSGARVLLIAVDAPQAQPRTTISDVDGTYQFVLPHDSGGKFRVFARRPGYLQGLYGQRAGADLGEDVTVAPGAVTSNLDVTLLRPAVVTGRIFDENGDPVEGALVRPLTVRTVDGRRRLAPMPVAARPTDDLGRYQVSSLPGGDYVLFAVVGQITGTDVAIDLPGYATTYYPGTPSAAEAQFVSVRTAQEVTGVDFSFLRTKTVRIAGRAVDAEGEPVTGGIALNPTRRSGVVAPVAAGARIERDGSFEFMNVPAGEYVLQFSRHRNGTWNEGDTASLFVTVTDADVIGLDVHLSHGSTIAGHIVVEGGGTVKPDDIEISPIVIDPDRSPTFSGRPARALVREDLRFELAGLQGPRRLRVHVPAGFALKAILLNGADVTDTVLQFGRPNQSLEDVEVVLTNRVSEIAGTVVDARGRPATDAVAIAFAVDSSLRYARSRFIAAATCDRDARFHIEGLPPGDYYLASIDGRQVADLHGEIENLDFLESLVPGSQRVALADGQRAMVSIKLGGR